MASLLSTVDAKPTARPSSPEYPSSSDPPIPSSDSFFSSGRKRYGEDEYAVGKKPRVSDVFEDDTENNHFEMDVDMDIKPDISNDIAGVNGSGNGENDEMEMAMEKKVRPSRPLGASTRVNRRVITSTKVAVKEEKPEVVIPKPEAKPVPAAAHWSTITSELDEVKAPVGLVQAENVLEDDSLRIFWLDYMEQNGVVHLIGKVLDRQSGKYVSACVSVHGIKRNLFVKPRAKLYGELSSPNPGTLRR